MDLILNWLQSGLSAIGPFLILLGLLIFVHELGHFLVAKWCGVRVEVFSLGFGKKILKFTRGETTYCISIVPLGGYVKMYGDDPTAEIPESEKSRAFLSKPVIQRIAIVLAGPLMNFLFAIPLFMAVGLNGELVPGPRLGDVEPESSAFQAGFRSGDKILSMNEEAISYWSQITKKIEASVDREIQFKVIRFEGGETVSLKASPALVPNDNILTLDTLVPRIPGLDPSGRSSMVGVSSPQSPAALAGLKTFDIITSINGVKVNSFWELEPTLQTHRNSEKLELVVRPYTAKANLENRTVVLTDFHKLSKTVDESKSLLDVLGLEESDLYLLQVKENSPAARAGLRDGDKIIGLDKTPVEKWDQVLGKVKAFKSEDKLIHFSIAREGKAIDVDIAPEMTEVMNRNQKEENRFTVGIIPAILESQAELTLFRVNSPAEAVSYGFEKTIDWTKAIAVSFLRILTAQVSHKNIGGVITIGRVASQTFEMGISAFLRMMAIISINLFLINLLPVPILDGGHLVFFVIEALRGAPLSMRKMEIAQQVGLILLISLMVLSLFNDITSFVKSP